MDTVHVHLKLNTCSWLFIDTPAFKQIPLPVFMVVIYINKQRNRKSTLETIAFYGKLIF